MGIRLHLAQLDRRSAVRPGDNSAERYFDTADSPVVRIVNLRGNDADRGVDEMDLPHEKARLTVKVQLGAGVTPGRILDHFNRAIVDADGREARPPLELLFDPRGKQQRGIHLGAFEISSRQREDAHQFVRRSDPTVVAVVGRDAVSVLRMDNGRQLIGRAGKNVYRHLHRERVVSLVRALGNKTRELGKLRRSANGLNVLVENLVG